MNTLRWYQFTLLWLVTALGLWSPASMADTVILDRHALVIGNSNYQNLARLKNPGADAAAIAATLETLGFQTSLTQDADLKTMRRAVREFTAQLTQHSAALIFYAGHGVQSNGENFLLPVDADVGQNWQLEEESLTLRGILRALDTSRAPLRILMLDACRDNPLRSAASPTRSLQRRAGLAPVEASIGTLMSFATQPDNVALDGKGPHSPYTEALLRRLPTRNISIGDMLNLVGNDVVRTTQSRQQPWQSSSPIPAFCFSGCNSPGSSGQFSSLLNSFAERFADADLDGLKQLVPLTEPTQQRLQNLFASYHHFTLSFDSVEYSADGKTRGIDMTIRQALPVQSAGTNKSRVFPSPSWGHYSLLAENIRDNWGITNFNSRQPGNSTQTIDLLAPDLRFSTLEVSDEREGRKALSIIIDHASDLNAAVLYYRDPARTRTYRSTPLQKDVKYRGKGLRYKATLPSDIEQFEGFELYLEAVDTSGNRVQKPYSQSPLSLSLTKSAINQTTGHGGSTSRRWWYIGLGLVAAAVMASQIDDGGEDDGTRPVVITTVLP